jgi:hypothetical protein
MTRPWVEGGFDKVTCSCGAEFDNVGAMIQHAQIAHGTDVDS